MKGSRSRVRAGFYSLLFLLVVSSAPAWAVDLREGLDQMATQLAKGVPEGKPFRVAVADFPDLQGVISDLGRFIANRITTRLVQNPKFSVIERQRLNQVLGELKFSMSDLVDPNKAKQLGRMVGVEGLIVGAVSDLGNQVDVDARMIEIESNKMLLGATVTISKDEVVTKMLERGREMPAPPSVAGGPLGSPMIAAPAPGGSPRVIKYQEFAKLRVEVTRFYVDPDGDITIFLDYINKTQEELEIALNNPYDWGLAPKTFLIDNRGKRYEYVRGTGLVRGWAPAWGRWEGGTGTLSLFPGERTSATMIFKGEKESGKREKKLFNLISDQLIVGKDGKIAGSFSIAIRDMESQ